MELSPGEAPSTPAPPAAAAAGGEGAAAAGVPGQLGVQAGVPPAEGLWVALKSVTALGDKSQRVLAVKKARASCRRGHL